MIEKNKESTSFIEIESSLICQVMVMDYTLTIALALAGLRLTVLAH